MAEGMPQDQIIDSERMFTGSSKTNNDFFEENGYYVYKNICDPKDYVRPVPTQGGLINYWGNKLNQFNYESLECQVEGSLACYGHPQYRQKHSQIRLKIEKVIGKKLYNTYYYDRYYFKDQGLAKHTDRPACEISVSINIASNLSQPWPLWIKTPDEYENKHRFKVTKRGENRSVILNPGDGMIYKGCERPHWREAMPKEYKRTWYGKKVEREDVYYHQIFFHYVLADGLRTHCAFDASR